MQLQNCGRAANRYLALSELIGEGNGITQGGTSFALG